MNYVYGTIVAALLGFLAWVYKMFQGKKELERLLAGERADKKLREWDDKIKDQSNIVSEAERDYAKAKEEFNSKHSGDSN